MLRKGPENSKKICTDPRGGNLMAAVETATSGKWHDRYPELGTAPLPVEAYTSAEQFALEREHIFRTVWLNVCRVEQIPNPGDYFVRDIGICNTSVVIVRGKDNQIRAFHNICSHRGNKVVWDHHGSEQMFTCKFHGWSYALDGSLKFVPDEENFFDLNKDCLGLTPVHIDVWEGFVFVNVAPEPEETLQEYLGELATELAGYPFTENSATAFSWRTEVKANWKIVKDAFQEVYHVGFLHKRSIPDSFTSRANPYAHVLDMKVFPRHGRASLFGNTDHTPSPVEALAFKHGSLIIPNEISASTLPAGVNPTRGNDWALELHTIFPCFFVDVSDGTYFTHQFWPVAVDRTVWESTTYFPKATTPGQRFSQEYSKVIFRDIIMEDGRTLEETQSVLSSGAKKEFFLHDEELLVRHSHQVIQHMIESQQSNLNGHANGKTNGNGKG
jgi:phenylpropionate dioxygenase-like ring-hydroxylating dioxygenase large terminal subunit